MRPIPVATTVARPEKTQSSVTAARLASFGWYVEQGTVIICREELAQGRLRPIPRLLDSDAAWGVSVVTALRNTKIDIDFEDAPLEDIVDYIGECAGIDIEFDREPIVDGTSAKLSTIRVKGWLLEDLLKSVLEPNGLSMGLVDHVLLITRSDRPK